MAWTPNEMIEAVRRARLLRVLLVYVGASFAVLEAVDVLTDNVGLPDWVFPGAVVLLLVGFPIIVATALAQSARGTSSQQAQEVPGEADGAESTAAGSTIAVPGPIRRWLTWRRAILGGVLAFALLGLATTGYMVMRVLGIGPIGSLVAAGVLDEREPILLADFENKTDDPLMADVVTEAFRIDIAQSPVVTVAEREWVSDVLERMERQPDTPLDLPLAREIAIREGLKAVIAGEVGRLGTSYVLSAEIVTAESGEVLAAFRETASDEGAIVGAVDELSEAVRERIGESFKTIQGSPPLEDVTTGSLEALKKFTQAERAIYQQGDAARGIALIEEALALDSTFAAAWAELGTTLSNQREQRARAVEALTRAYQYRDRLPDRERYHTVATYYLAVTEEREKAINAFHTLLESYPDDDDALHQLALLYAQLRGFARAEELFSRSLQIDSTFAITFQALINAQVAQAKFADAETALARMREQTPEHFRVPQTAAALAAARGDYEAAEAAIRDLRESREASLLWRANTSEALAMLARVRGRLADAESHLRDALSVQEERALPAEILRTAIEIAWLDVWFRGRPERGIEQVEQALERYPLSRLPALDRPYLELANFYAVAGQADRARYWVDEFEGAVEPNLRRGFEGGLHRARGWIALTEDRAADAVAQFRAWDEGMMCTICALPDLGLAYQRAGVADSARAVYERYVERPWLWRMFPDSYALGYTYERLARLYEEGGEPRKAISTYNKLVELWADADPELQSRVESARRAMQALSSDR